MTEFAFLGELSL